MSLIQLTVYSACVYVLSLVHVCMFVCFQLEDTDSPADVPEEVEDNTTASQVGNFTWGLQLWLIENAVYML